MTKKDIIKEIQILSDNFNSEKLNINTLLNDLDSENNIEKKQAIKEIIDEKLIILDELEDKYKELVEKIKS